ncbi:hypothetical protein KKG41_02820 [Patescibacteria group bacterium]|nr:hypothetical protein [Patescibacteria group bacterium]MBU1890069.1 hypothetical protein [Patescibacteria group bacterium]
MRYFWGAFIGMLVAVAGWVYWVGSTFTNRPTFLVWPLGAFSSVSPLIVLLSDVVVAGLLGMIIASTMSVGTFDRTRFIVYTTVVAVAVGATAVLANRLTFMPFVVWVMIVALAIRLWQKNNLRSYEELFLAVFVGPGLGVGLVSGLAVGLVVSICSFILFVVCLVTTMVVWAAKLKNASPI